MWNNAFLAGRNTRCIGEWWERTWTIASHLYKVYKLRAMHTYEKWQRTSGAVRKILLWPKFGSYCNTLWCKVHSAQISLLVKGYIKYAPEDLFPDSASMYESRNFSILLCAINEPLLAFVRHFLSSFCNFPLEKHSRSRARKIVNDPAFRRIYLAFS